MKILFLIFILSFTTFLHAEIDERKSDVYFVNGIDTAESIADASLYRIRDDIELNSPESFKQVSEWKANYNHTRGFRADVYEMAVQWVFKKLNENKDWQYKYATFYIFDETFGKIPGAKDVVKGVIQYAGKKIGKGVLKDILLEEVKRAFWKKGLKLSKEDIAFLSEEVFDGVIDDLLDGLKDETKDEINKDIDTHYKAYNNSIKNGHGVIIVSHGQGNFYTNFIVDGYQNSGHSLMADWQKNYIHAFGVAPSTSSVANGGGYITFDNDIVQSVPGHLGWNEKNPTRYTYKNAANEDIETFFSLEAHNFLSSYMATEVSHKAILNFIEGAVKEHNKASSQWKKSKELGCGCDKRIRVVHKYDSSLDTNMTDIDVVKFDEELKLYPIDGQYYKGSYEGDSVEDYTQEERDDDLCMELQDSENVVIDQFEAIDEDVSTKGGVVEITLDWDKPELDFDLEVAWGAGEVDVKDVCKPMEHFHIKSEMQIYPGSYQVFIKPKDADAEIFKDPSIYPITVELVTRTPGASDKMKFVIKNSTDIVLGHVSDIKVYRNDNEDDEKEEEDENSTSSVSVPSFYIAPQPAPECPPVEHTPSPAPPKPIHFSSGSSGSYSLHLGGGSGGGYYYNSSSGSSSGGSGGGFTAQQDPSCAGDLSCLSKPTDYLNNSNDHAGGEYAPLDPIVGGKPVRNLPDDDNCTGDKSCGCIPCEYEIIPYLNQVYFGPLRDANFSIYTLDGYDSNVSIYDGKTSGGETLYDAGELDLPQGILNMLEDEKLYIIKADGGEDIDYDDNFIVDTTPTKNLGKVYAIARGEEIKSMGLKINILTTLTFELVEQMVLDGNSTKEIESKIEEIASRLLRYKVYPNSVDTNISNTDLLAWLPTVDKDLLLQSYEPLEGMVSKIFKGESIDEDAYKYVYFTPKDSNNTTETIIDENKPPIIKTFVKTIPENFTSGSHVGTIKVLRGSEDITFGKLSGVGSDKFEVNTEGDIYLKSDAVLDYETKWLYKLKVEAFNKNGSTGKVGVYISVKNILDAPEYVEFEGGVVDEDAPSGTVVGKVVFSEGLSAISSIEMQGESTDEFDIDINGVITLADGAALDYESKYSYGFVVIAKNSYGTSMPAIVYINVKDIADSPKITNYTGGYVYENASPGTVVGQVVFEKGGANISSMKLEGAGSENFTIDLNGTIRVSQNASLDYETSVLYQPLVTVKNTYGSDNRKIFISVVDTLDVPSLVSFSGGNVKEHSPVGTVVGQLVFETGSMPIESISIIEGSDNFTILDNGTIVVAKDALNYEQKNSYLLKVVAKNALGSSQVVSVKIYVDDIAEKTPTLEDFVVNDVAEDLPVGTIIGTINVLDVGSSQISEFVLSGSNANYFTVDSNGIVKTAKLLDYEKIKTYNLKVKAKNLAWYGREVNLIIRLQDIVDEVPVLNNTSFEIDENSTVVGQVNIRSSGDSPIKEFILSGDGSELFDINASGFISVKQTSNLDYDRGIKYFRPMVTAVNDTGKSIAKIVYIDLKNVVDIPEVEPLNLSIDENIELGTLIAKLEIDSGKKALLSVSFNGSDAAAFDIDIQGNITVKSNIDYEQKQGYHFYVTASNEYGISLTQIIHIDVNDLADEPVLHDFNVSINENIDVGTIVGKIEFTNGVNPIDSFVLSGDGSNNFYVDINGTIFTNSDIDYEKQKLYNFKVIALTVSEKSNLSNVQININNIVEVPILEDFSTSLDESLSQGVVVGKVNIIKDGDTPIESMQLSGVGSEEFVISKDGLISLREECYFDYERQHDYNLSVVANISDRTSEATKVNISINNVLDAPTYIDFSGYIGEDANFGDIVGVIQSLPLRDINATSMQLIGENNEHFSITKEGVIKVANTQLDYEKQSFYELKARASSVYGGSNIVEVNININDIDEYAVAGLGRWANANVNIYKIETNGTKSLIFNDTTSAANQLDSIGLFDSHKLDLNKSAFYIYEVSGGEDNDIDNDGIIDPTPTTNKGTIHAIVKGAWVQDSDWRPRINLLTEVYYQWAIEYIDNLEEFESRLINPLRSSLNLNKDLNGDSYSYSYYGNAIDALIYDPVNDLSVWNSSKFPKRSLEDIQNRIYKNDPTSALYISNSFLQQSDIYMSGENLVSKDKTKIYMLDRSLDVIDISDINEIGNTTIMEEYMRNMTISDDQKYLFFTIREGEGDMRLKIFDISDILNPTEISSMPNMVYANKMKLSHDATKLYTTFQTYDTSNFKVIDVSDKSNPVKGTQITTSGQAFDFMLSQDERTVYLCDDRGGLKIIDISDPNNMKIVGEYIANGLVQSVQLSEDETKAFVSVAAPTSNIYVQKGHIDIVDITDKTNPTLISNLDLNSSRITAFKFNNDKTKLFVSMSNGVPEYNDKIYDISGDFQKFKLLGETSHSYYTSSDKLVLLDNETIMLAVSSYKIDVVDISNPENPIILNTIQLKPAPS